MLVRNDELKAFFDLKVPMFRVHRFDGTRCTCGNPDCIWPDNRSSGKHPATINGVHAAQPQLNADQFEGYNIGIACGIQIAVVDVDPRNGGNESLKRLISQHGTLPKTWTASTGEGLHYYFSVQHQQKTGKRVAGIDLIGYGNYVLAPTSLHPNGKTYEWLISPDDCELSPLPQWIIDECCITTPTQEKKSQHSDDSTIYSDQDVADALEYLDPNCSNDEWVKVGMALCRGGYSVDLFDQWSSGGGDKYKGKADVEKRWKSFHKGGGSIGIGTLFWMAEQRGWSPRPVVRWDLHKKPEKKEEPQTNQRYNTDGIDFPPGPIGIIARDILDAAMFKHKSFAISSALSIAGALSQGRYCSPNGEGCLGSYTFLVTDSGGGKADYTNPFSECVRTANPLLLMGEVASGQALRKTLETCPSRALSLDEGIKWLMAMIDSKNENAQRLHSDFLSAWSGSTINQIVTKDSAASSPEVKNPRVTILGAGPKKSLVKLLQDGESLADEGLLSRIDFLIGEPAEPSSFVKLRKYRPSQPLCEIFQDIGCGIGKNKASHSKLVDLNAQEMKPTLQFDKITTVEWGPGSIDLFNQFASFCYRKKISSGLPSVWSRTAEKALRIGCLLAIFNDPQKPIVDDYMLRWAIEWQRAIALEIEALCSENLGKSQEAMCRDKIIFALEKEGGSCSRLRVGYWWRGWKKVDERTKHAAIEGLERDGIIIVSESDAKKNRGEQRLALQSKKPVLD
jgi:hypothetical protein